MFYFSFHSLSSLVSHLSLFFFLSRCVHLSSITLQSQYDSHKIELPINYLQSFIFAPAPFPSPLFFSPSPSFLPRPPTILIFILFVANWFHPRSTSLGPLKIFHMLYTILNPDLFPCLILVAQLPRKAIRINSETQPESGTRCGESHNILS